AKQFFEHPDRHEVLYDTGDLGRYLSDGNIEFLGREDFQVKLNGHRVELGEISSQLQGHPDIAEAVVKVCKHGQDQQQLTAYIVPDKTLDNPLYQWQTAPEQVLNPLWEELESAADRQLERSVKNQTRRLQIFAQFWDKVEQISLVAMIETLRSLSNEMLPLEQLENALADQGVKPQNFTLVKQWVELLKNKKVIDTSQGYIEFRESAALPQRALSQLLEELKKFTTWDETANDFYEYIENCITQQINLLKGQVAPLDLLFPKGSWRVAESIYQHNPIAQHHNSVMGEITKSIVEAENRKNKIRILEVGAGTGAATESLLRELPAEKVEYVYTDLSSYFTTLAKQKFKDYPFIRYARYDIDKGPLAQGYQSHSFDMVVAVNVLHDAKNIEAALKKLRCLLVPGGLLLLLEGTQNTAFQMVTVAFLEGFGHFRDERLNDNLPLLNTSQWKHKLVDCGFEKVAVFPKKSPLLDAFEQHVILARGPEEVKIFQGENRLKEYLKSRLPTYMVPKKIVEMDFLPVNTNGKIDLNSLPGVEINTLDEKQVFAAPHSDYEKKIAAIWCEILQIKSVGIHHNFFDVGADSLLLIQTKNRINEAFKVKVTSTDLLQYTTISELARYLKSIVDPSEINKTSDTSANNQRALKQKEAIVRQHRMIEKRRQNV
ncbi:MAG: methyltransferase, partial [Exilibacterium sp.]